MIWILIIIIVGYVLIRFFNSLNKDSYDLQGRALDDKFNVIVNMINKSAFNGRGSVIPISNKSFNLYEDGQNQIINFHYSTGHLTVTWKYKYFQKEVVHERQFNDVRNLSLFQQQKIGEQMVVEMKNTIERHKNSVMRDAL